MSFVCEVRGCDNEAKVARKCVKHALETVRRKHGLEPREEETDEKEPKENSMTEKTCSECGQEPKKGERLYREKCPECRNKGKAERKPRKKKEVSIPSPSTGEGLREGEGRKYGVTFEVPVDEIRKRPSMLVIPVGFPPLHDDVPADDDMVDHPPHYNRGKIEVAAFIDDQGLDFFSGNVVKYVSRAPHKGKSLEDLKKARWYLNYLIDKAEGRK